MADLLTLEVVTPTGLKLRTEADSVEVPSVGGEFGVLPGHVPVLAALRSGLLKYKLGNETHTVAVGPGFAEAEPDKVLLLTDLFAHPDDIDVAEAREDLVEATKELAKFDELYEGREYEELQRNVDWAQARIDAAPER